MLTILTISAVLTNRNLWLEGEHMPNLDTRNSPPAEQAPETKPEMPLAQSNLTTDNNIPVIRGGPGVPLTLKDFVTALEGAGYKILRVGSPVNNSEK